MNLNSDVFYYGCWPIGLQTLYDNKEYGILLDIIYDLGEK